jgi:ADP-ribosyl-[dinitrogen reductase] hydrolase
VSLLDDSMPGCAGSARRTSRHDAVRTSLSHPLRIDEVAVGAGGGRIGLCICPGKQGPSVIGPPWQRDLALDLDVVQRWQPDAVLTLIEAHEMQMLGVSDLGTRIRSRGIEWFHLPIVDMQPPDAGFESDWVDVGPRLTGYLNGGGRVLVHCRGGLGRAGTVAARLLVELGWPASEAIARVRRARPAAIETRQQLQYVVNLALSR